MATGGFRLRPGSQHVRGDKRVTAKFILMWDLQLLYPAIQVYYIIYTPNSGTLGGQRSFQIWEVASF